MKAKKFDSDFDQGKDITKALDLSRDDLLRRHQGYAQAALRKTNGLLRDNH